jgi:hypothetical protein
MRRFPPTLCHLIGMVDAMKQGTIAPPSGIASCISQRALNDLILIATCGAISLFQP